MATESDQIYSGKQRDNVARKSNDSINLDE